MNVRELRGQEIAAGMKIRRQGARWIVPSQSGRGSYIVDLNGRAPVCTCPDYELHGRRCKHVFAVEHYLACDTSQKRDTTPTPKPPRPTTRQDWPAYNLAQTIEKAQFQALLHALCRDIPEPEQVMGRPRLPLREMVFAAAFKVYSTVSGRRFICDLEDAHAKGYLTRVPCYNSIFNYFEMPELTPILHALIADSSRPMQAVETIFAADSSGFSTCQYVRWYDVKYGHERDYRDWLKAHLMCGVTTNIVTSVEITGKERADVEMLETLVDSTARRFPIAEVVADKGYSSRSNLEYLVGRGITPFVPFRSNARDSQGRSQVWDDLYHVFHLQRDAFLAHYHRRSVVESTFWMIKSKFGAALRSKTEVAQVNELLCKILCHNVCCVIQSMHELGIEAQF